jgi:hypothetical protein
MGPPLSEAVVERTVTSSIYSFEIKDMAGTARTPETRMPGTMGTYSSFALPEVQVADEQVAVTCSGKRPRTTASENRGVRRNRHEREAASVAAGASASVNH